MDTGNQTHSGECRFLSEEHFHALYEAFIEAFSDYVFPFALTETQFGNHIKLNAVDLARTVGFVENGRIVAFSLNGFGEWKGRRTVYDAGTGVVPTHRRRGLSDRMFEMMLPIFDEWGYDQCLLEVVTTNDAAINLYKKLGYETRRELALLQCEGEIKSNFLKADIEIKPLDDLDWDRFRTFWDGEPSWQNSVDAMERSRDLKLFLGAFDGGECIGYVIFAPKVGRIAQMAVHPDYRRRGVGTALLRSVRGKTEDGFSMQVINIDKAMPDASQFFVARGFTERVSQFEMIKAIR